MLELAGIEAWYGEAHVLHGVDLTVGAGETVALIGRNGAGKTTTLRTVMGLARRWSGTVRFAGEDLSRLPVHARFRRGLGYVPENRRIVPGLTVEENLRLGLAASARRRQGAQALERAFATFPRLKDRMRQRAATMSGGEQQMLAIARALVSAPRMLMLDEPTEGIMPILVEEIAALLKALRAEGVTILLVEQNVELALSLADRAYILDQGVVVHHDTAARLAVDPDIQERYCSV